VLDPKGWLSAAQNTPEGARRRVDHDCGGGRTLTVSNTATGWRAFCFRCDDHGWVAKPQPTLAERLARRKAERQQDARIVTTVALPEPVNTDVATWPQSAAAWLYKAGIGKPEIARLGAYWHAPSGRVVLPIVEDDTIVYWQARAPDWTRRSQRPKYVNPAIDKSALVARYGNGSDLVLTEDILSAFRVGQVTQAWGLLGTNLTDAVLARVLAADKPVAVWLDPDAAGRKASRSIAKRLMVCGQAARIIQSEKDPKLLSRREIETVIRPDLVAAAENPRQIREAVPFGAGAGH